MAMFVTHASVRVKGSEHCYEPIWCSDADCAKHPTPHMHCPFCTRTEFYLDPVILRAHYRVKHVDKGIDVYGLRVVRCCDRCDIVGSIKGSKEIRGAHWHCYRCRNGFNRRDEAIKHYRTHFRSPQTTYQIQIISDVNQVFASRRISDNFTNSSVTNGNTEMGVQCNGASTVQQQQEPVAANETVATSTADMQLLIIEGDAVDIACSGPDLDINNSVDMTDEVVATDIGWTISSPVVTDSRLVDLQQLYDRLAADKRATENRLQSEVEALQRKVDEQTREIARLRQAAAAATSGSDTTSLLLLMDRLRSEHDQLLQRQLGDVRREFLQLLVSRGIATSDINYSVVHHVTPDVDGLPQNFSEEEGEGEENGAAASYAMVASLRDATPVAETEATFSISKHESSPDIMPDDTDLTPSQRITQKRARSSELDLECTASDEDCDMLDKNSKVFCTH